MAIRWTAEAIKASCSGSGSDARAATVRALGRSMNTDAASASWYRATLWRKPGVFTAESEGGGEGVKRWFADHPGADTRLRDLDGRGPRVEMFVQENA